MYRSVLILLAPLLLAACAGSGDSRQDDKPAQLKLEPSARKVLPDGSSPLEVLSSNERSGAYIAFVPQVPNTRYFKVLGRADCDDYVYLQLISPKQVRAAPNYYISPNYTEDKAAYQCARAFHAKFRDGTDERLTGSDGVIFDHTTAIFTKTDTALIAMKKLAMTGWAIRFEDPTADEIIERFKTAPNSAIDHVQVRAAAYWAEHHPDPRFAPAMADYLKLGDNLTTRTGWNETRLAVLRSMARLDTPSDSLAPYRRIMEAGLYRNPFAEPGRRIVSPLTEVASAPQIAANVLACRHTPLDLELLRAVFEQSASLQHATAAARALALAGETGRIKTLAAKGQLGNLQPRVQPIIDGRDSLAFTCPYRSV